MTLTEDEFIQILKLIEESNFNEFHLEMGDLKLMVRKGDKASSATEDLKPKTSA